MGKLDDGDMGVNIIVGIALILAAIFLVVSVIDDVWVKPVAADKANQHCETRGFDFYESFERIGILSEDPVAITCKYVEQYRKIDINRPLVEVNI